MDDKKPTLKYGIEIVFEKAPIPQGSFLFVLGGYFQPKCCICDPRLYTLGINALRMFVGLLYLQKTNICIGRYQMCWKYMIFCLMTINLPSTQKHYFHKISGKHQYMYLNPSCPKLLSITLWKTNLMANNLLI